MWMRAGQEFRVQEIGKSDTGRVLRFSRKPRNRDFCQGRHWLSQHPEIFGRVALPLPDNGLAFHQLIAGQMAAASGIVAHDWLLDLDNRFRRWLELDFFTAQDGGGLPYSSDDCWV